MMSSAFLLQNKPTLLLQKVGGSRAWSSKVLRISRSGLVARAQQVDDDSKSSVVSPEPSVILATEDSMPTPVAVAGGAAPAEGLAAVFGETQEAINGRAAQLGFLAAIVTEVITGQSVWSQLAGKYVNGDLVEKPHGLASLTSFAVVAVLTVASFAPRIIENEGPTSRAWGPFKPNVELLNGRSAMLGFLALLLVEFLRGNTPVF